MMQLARMAADDEDGRVEIMDEHGDPYKMPPQAAIVARGGEGQ